MSRFQPLELPARPRRRLAPGQLVPACAGLLAAALSLAAAAGAAGQPPAAEPKRLTIVHTNDLQSRLLPFAPEADYTPLTLGDDATIGGIARLATVIRGVRDRAPEHTLVLDGGDILMGTLFHTVARETGAELRLLQQIGYDAAVLGNHEFDFRPAGLARILQSAAAQGPLPALLLSNALFDPADPADDALEAHFRQGLVRETLVLQRAGLRIGLFGLMGLDAAEVEAPYARPVRFEDSVQAARRIVQRLREQDAVDVVVCLSHGGVQRLADGSWGGEDVELALQVPGIDVIVGGHSHTALPQPIQAGSTLIVQAGSEARFAGVLELDVAGGSTRLAGYTLVPVDDSVAAAPDIHEQVEAHKRRIEEQILRPLDLRFDQAVLHTGFDLAVDEAQDPAASNLGPFFADLIREGTDRLVAAGGGPAGARTDVALTTAGVLRDSLRRGRSGLQRASDVFRVVPLGIGSVEASIGVPMACIYLTARELRDTLEVLCLVHRLKGTQYYPYFSGLRFRYNPYRLPLDRVIDIELGDEVRGFELLDLSASNERLYSVGLSVYLLHFIGLIDEVSRGLLSVQPKTADGRPIHAPDEALLDANASQPGVQEVKQWIAVLEALRQLPDTDADGIPDVPERYRQALPRMVEVASLHPALLLGNATRLTAAAAALALLAAGVAVWLGRKLARRMRGGPRPPL